MSILVIKYKHKYIALNRKQNTIEVNNKKLQKKMQSSTFFAIKNTHEYIQITLILKLVIQKNRYTINILYIMKMLIK